MSLVTETNQQYYQGAQVFVVESATGQTDFKTSFNTDLVFGSFDPTITNYALNNFKIYTSATGLPNSFTEYLASFLRCISAGDPSLNGFQLVLQNI